MNTKAMIIGNGSITTAITQYLNEVSYILLLDNHLDKISSFIDIQKVDAILGDFDTVNNVEQLKSSYPNITIIHAPDQNYTDFDKGIRYLLKLGFKHILGFGLTGKRTDHTFNNIASLAKYDVHIQLIDDYSKIECIHHYFERVYSKGTIISLLPIGKVIGITTTNLVYALHNEDLELGIRTGSSNAVIQDGNVTITTTNGKLILMECWD